MEPDVESAVAIGINKPDVGAVQKEGYSDQACLFVDHLDVDVVDKLNAARTESEKNQQLVDVDCELLVSKHGAALVVVADCIVVTAIAVVAVKTETSL